MTILFIRSRNSKKMKDKVFKLFPYKKVIYTTHSNSIIFNPLKPKINNIWQHKQNNNQTLVSSHLMRIDKKKQEKHNKWSIYTNILGLTLSITLILFHIFIFFYWTEVPCLYFWKVLMDTHNKLSYFILYHFWFVFKTLTFNEYIYKSFGD